MSPLRVLHIDSASEYRGGQNQARLLIRALRETTDLRQGLVASRGSRLVEEAASLGIDVRPVAWQAAIDPRPVLRIRREMRAGWDLVHAHDSHGLQTALAARMLAGGGVPIVASRRVAIPMRSPSTWRRADAIIAVSEPVRSMLRAQGIDDARIRVIHSGVSTEELAPSLPGRLREAASVAPAVPFVGAVGALTREKGHAWFVRAAAQVTREFPDARFAVFGEGPERQALVRLATSLGLQDRVAFPGRIEQIGRSLADLDLFVMPSLSEGLGTVAVEAMLAGCPVVLSGAGGLAELAGDELPAIPPGDVAALAAEISRLLADRAARSLLAKRASARGAQFTVERMMHATLDLYRKVAAFPGEAGVSNPRRG